MVVFLSGNISDSKVQIIVNNTALYHRNDYTAGEPFAETGRYAGQNEVILQLTDRFAVNYSGFNSSISEALAVVTTGAYPQYEKSEKWQVISNPFYPDSAEWKLLLIGCACTLLAGIALKFRNRSKYIIFVRIQDRL